MKTISSYSSALRQAVRQSNSGIVAMVDSILSLCREHNLQLDWRADRCLLRPLDGEWEEVTDLSIRKAVFRAILARISVLCCEQSANAMSPYGGQAKVNIGETPITFRVIIENTQESQRLQLMPENHGNCPRTEDAIR